MAKEQADDDGQELTTTPNGWSADYGTLAIAIL
jgi:hypothetical protein